MGIFYIKLALLSVICIHAITLENDCGSITQTNLITNTRPAHITFSPNTKIFNETLDVRWMVEGDKTKTLVNNTGGVQTQIDGRDFHLRLRDPTKYAEFGLFYATYGSCESRTLRLEITNLGNCGLLQLRPSTLTSGHDVRMVYLPTASIWSHVNVTDVKWLFYPRACRRHCMAVNISEKYSVGRREAEAEYAMTILNVDHRVNGVYSVECDDGTMTNNVTIDVIVLEPPSQPVIFPMAAIDGKQYVIGRDKQPLNIACNTTGGTKPVNVSILVNKELVSSSLHNNVYMPNSHYKLTGSNHMEKVTCEVSNSALLKPLVASTTIYMIQNPVNPKLVMSEVVEFRPVNISCSVTNVRPAPHITFHIGSDVVAANQTSKREDMMGAYSIRASLDRMERRWNGKKIHCCVSNELYTPNTTCTEDRVVSYKFQWTALSIQLPNIITAVRPYHVISVTCIVKNANPKCEPTWTGKGSLFISRTRGTDVMTSDGGVTSQSTATLNVSSKDNGALMKCYADCSRFGRNVIVYEIQVPAKPVIFINVSDSNTSVVDITFSESLVLECSAKSEPRSEISWRYTGNRTGVQVTECGTQSKCLILGPVDSSHNGHYTCHAENKYGLANTTIELAVTGMPFGFGDIDFPPLTSLLAIVLGAVALLFVFGMVGALIFVLARRTKRKTSDLAAPVHSQQATITPSDRDEEPSALVVFNPTYDASGSESPQHQHPPETACEHPINADPQFNSVFMTTKFRSDASKPQEQDIDMTGTTLTETKEASDDKNDETSASTLISLEDIQKIAPLPPSSLM